ncbi:hypothetical protein QQ045_011038 [Rhodiola kirilowii]
MASPSVLLLCISFALLLSVVHGIGVNYGLLGDNLPPPAQTLAMLQERDIHKIRIFDPNQTVLTALIGTNISVFIGVRNEDLQPLATDPSFASKWVQNNILPYANKIYISGVVAGNEVIPGPLANFVVQAMTALHNALSAANVTVPVSTAVSYAVIGTSYPPSNGSFCVEAADVMKQVVSFLELNKYPLLANIYPYFAYISNPVDISSNYTLFIATDPVVTDGEHLYYNLFDSMVDALYTAIERAGAPSTRIVVSETGWPSAGDVYATMENARLYNQGLVNHINTNKGTTKRPGEILETYIFAIYNEDLKPAGTEQNFGLFYPNLTEVYHVDFPVSTWAPG